jgi:hypothetical protein
MYPQQGIHWIEYSLETGEFTGHGGASSPDAMAPPRPGHNFIISPTDMVKVEHEHREGVGQILIKTIDLDAVRASLHGVIDYLAARATGAWRPIYLEKEAQARAAISGAAVDDIPMIALEASLGGRSVHEVAKAVVDAADGARREQMAIEAKRAAAKYKISQETNLARLAELARADFDAG